MAKTIYVKPRYSWRDRKIKRAYYKKRDALKDAREAIERGSRLSKELFGDSYAEASIPQKRMRRALNFRGEGDYEAFKPWLKYGSRAVGAGLAAVPAFMTGGWGKAIEALPEGWEAGARFSKSVGWGDYSTPMITNQIMNGGTNASSDTPVMLNHMGDLSGDIILQHREFISNVTVSGTALEQKQYELNPGLKETFPFLSQIANNFELYKFEGLAFQFVPHYGEGEDSILGKVIMVTNYDPDARDFRTSQEMQNYDYACTAKPSLGQVHGVETDSTKRATEQLYVRSGDVARDKVFTDIGKFTIATEGIPKPGNIGELWVTYKIRLSRAHLNDIYREAVYNEANFTFSSATDFTSELSEGIISYNLVATNDLNVTCECDPESTYLVVTTHCQSSPRSLANKITSVGLTNAGLITGLCPGSGTLVNPDGSTMETTGTCLVKTHVGKKSFTIGFIATNPYFDTHTLKVTVKIIKVPDDRILRIE